MLRQTLAIALGAAICLAPSLALAAQEAGASPEVARPKEKTAQPSGPKIQMAILLDTSGSMSGLIDQARTQLWNIVNEFATTTQDGRRPTFELALFEYGKSSVSAEDGHIRLILPFSDNLDKVSEELFKLTTNGGSEHCGQAIDRATKQLQWSESSSDLKCIFIAGNEPFTQGPIDYRVACKNAITKGITISTIHCGDRVTGINGKWGDGALLADGSFASIDHNAKVAIAAPQDKELIKLSAEVNKTYIAFGSKAWRTENSMRQTVQDSNAVKSNSAAGASRAIAKCNSLYCNDSWDLVDALKNGKVKLVDVKPEELPEDMRKMSHKERETHIAALQKKRTQLQKQVNDLGKEREKYIANEMKKLAEKGTKVLDSAIIDAARTQYSKKGFKKSAPGVASTSTEQPKK